MFKLKFKKLSSSYKTKDATITSRIDIIELKIAKDPRVKKCGLKLFPIMFEKTKLLVFCTFRPTLFATCLIDKRPRIVIGQLFFRLHGWRERFNTLLLFHASFYRLNDWSGYVGQFSPTVHFLGDGWTLFLFAYLLLV